MSQRAKAQMAIEIVEYREARNEWDQGTWMTQDTETECGSAGCLAGWLVHGLGLEEEGFAKYNTDYMGIAAKLLGLSSSSTISSHLFSGANSMDDLRLYICLLQQGRGDEIIAIYRNKWFNIES